MADQGAPRPVIAYRAGWPSRRYPPRRVGWCWMWVGPWVFGTVKRWDSNAQ
jgi:hypothetical protein